MGRKDKKMDARCVGAVYSTLNYAQFRKLKGNRTVLEARKNLIKDSIIERGWIRNPIVVNEFMEIIDGQGRFEALKELEMPIEFVVSNGATVDDCIALNLKQANWKMRDYIKCYAEFGNEDYIHLERLLSKYSNLCEQTVIMAAGRFISDGAETTKKVKRGAFRLYNPDKVCDRIDFIKKCLDIVGKGNGRERHWGAILKFVYQCNEIDNDRFIDRLNKHRILIEPCVSAKACMENFEKIYNYRCGTKTYFPPLWDKYIADCRNQK